ncbi:MAG: caspase family protein [Gemmatimonadetes bacterium]|nr:caspase family protein [Gemmatimonadota bacterium]
MKRFGTLGWALAGLPLLMAFGPGERVAPSHWAVLVGISDYTHFEDVEGGDLPGAEHDARAMRNVLVSRWGFPDENVLVLLNGEATRAAIEEALVSWLPERVGEGDHVTVFFAGHGSQVWDMDGDEEDGLDETIAPADALPDSPDNDIVDEELGAWLRALPTRNVVYIHDNCNAGTGTRDVTPFSRARRLARDPGVMPRPDGPARRALSGQEDESGFDLDGGDVLELAAAQPFEAAVDAFFEGPEGAEPFHGGAFTTFLVRQLWRAPADATYEDVFVDVKDALKRNRFQQDPMISPDVPLRARPLFFVEGGAAGPGGITAVPVLEASAGTARLGAGQALGLSMGSVLETGGGARLVVEDVERDRATARVSGGAVVAGDRATLTGYRYPENTLRVGVAGVDSETAAALGRALSGSEGVVLVEGEDAYADLFVRRRGSEVRLVGLDGFTRRTFLAGDVDAPAMAAALKGEAAAQRLTRMDNLGQAFDVRVWMEGGGSSLGLGESIRIHVSSEREGYLTLVDLGTNDQVTVLFPNAFHRDNRIRAGRAVAFPTDAMGFEIIAQEPAGRGMVRAFVTPEPLDLPVDAEGFVSGDLPLASRVAEAVRRAAGSVSGSPGAIRLDTWGTASLVYDITP